MRLPRGALTALVLVTSFLASSASPAEAQRARRRARAQVERLEGELHHEYSPRKALDLAEAYITLDRHLDAAILLDRVQDETTGRLQRTATELLEDVAAHISRLTVDLSGDRENVEVWVDGERLDLERLGRRLPLRPGRHVVSLNRGTVELESRTVSIERGGAVAVTLEVPEVARPEVAAEEAERGDDDPPDAAPILQDRSDDGDDESTGVFESGWFWGTLGLAAAAAAAVVVVLLLTDDSVQSGSLGTVDLR